MTASKRWPTWIVVAIVLLVLHFAPELEAWAFHPAKFQSAPDAFDSAITELASRLTVPFKHAHARKLVVLDLRGPNGQVHPVGKLLADQLSVAVREESPKIEVIDRWKLASENRVAHGSTDPDAIFAEEADQARSVGADTYVAGNFARISENQIGVSLSVVPLRHLEKTHELRAGIVPMSKELRDLSEEPIPGPVLKDGIPVAGKGGISVPICTYCPAQLSRQESWAHGVVRLDVVITSEGRPGKIEVVKSPSPELAAIAIRSVQDWRFKPAVGFDGKPITVVASFQLTFR